MKRKWVKTISTGILCLTICFVIAEGIGAYFLANKTDRDGGKSVLRQAVEQGMERMILPGIYYRENQLKTGKRMEPYMRFSLLLFPGITYRLQQCQTDESMYRQNTESDYEKILLSEARDEGTSGDMATPAKNDRTTEELPTTVIEGETAEELPTIPMDEGKNGKTDVPQREPFDDSTPLQFHYNWENYQTPDELVKGFYSVDSTTKADFDLMDVNRLLQVDCTVNKDTDGPQILIYHTHSQEAFADSVAGDESTSIVGVGEYLTQLLQEKYGYTVLHHTAHYDRETRDYAYSNALPEIEQILRDNPSIEVVIDLHRDEMPKDKKLITEVNGRPMAKFMFFNGMSRTNKGEIDYLKNDNLAVNLAFSFQMQATCNEYYPDLARKIYLKAYRYNMHVCPKTLLIELGAQNNTLEEVCNACDPLARVLALVLEGNGAKWDITEK